MSKTCKYEYLVGPRKGEICGRNVRSSDCLCFQHRYYVKSRVKNDDECENLIPEKQKIHRPKFIQLVNH